MDASATSQKPVGHSATPALYNKDKFNNGPVKEAPLLAVTTP